MNLHNVLALELLTTLSCMDEATRKHAGGIRLELREKTGVQRPASVQHSRRGDAVKRFFHKKSSKNCPPGGAGDILLTFW